jgi:hypothetical protein
MFERIVIAGGVSQLDDNGRGGAQGDERYNAYGKDHRMDQDGGDHGSASCLPRNSERVGAAKK